MTRALKNRLRDTAAWWVYFWGPDAILKPQTQQERAATHNFLDSAIEFFERRSNG